MPIPEINGEEQDHLEPASVLDALVELVGATWRIHTEKRSKEGLELRGAAVGAFEVCDNLLNDSSGS